MIEALSALVVIVTLSPISAVAFSTKFTLAMAAARPTAPTEAPITVEFTADTYKLPPVGLAMVKPLPLWIVASTLTEEALSITVLSPIRDVTEPA